MIFKPMKPRYNMGPGCYLILLYRLIIGINAEIWNIDNPRVEAEEHYYNPDHDGLRKLGFKPTFSLDDELRITIPKLLEYRKRIEEKSDHIMPTIKWRK